MTVAVRQSRLRAIFAGVAFAATVALALGLADAPSAWAQATPGAGPAATTPPAEVPVPATPPAVTTEPRVITAPPAEIPQEGASVEKLTYPVRPVAITSGSATWDDGYKTMLSAFAKIRAEMKTAGLEPAGRPITVFLETDDEGFKYDSMIPLAAAPAGGVQLANAVRVGVTPTGPALKFQHRGAYDEIDTTYEAITAYLDEKGLNAANLFIEEYLNDVATSDDNSLEVDIYVFLK